MSINKDSVVLAFVGSQIRSARNEKHLSQRELANRLPMYSTNKISKIEKGLLRIDVRQLQELAKALDKPFRFFI